jgi:hypothetical protein
MMPTQHYAHTVYFADNTYIVFGSGIVPPPPSTCQHCGGTGRNLASTLQDETQQPGSEEVASGVKEDGSVLPKITFTCADELDQDFGYEIV